ncbi:hypothetical protein KJ032_26850, partial [Salmonella enterica subsp. enterica serovar Typhimurium]|nr:hypothetical protein [Salmonella enterica subsp. enterica serovar Typhimurium]
LEAYICFIFSQVLEKMHVDKCTLKKYSKSEISIAVYQNLGKKIFKKKAKKFPAHGGTRIFALRKLHILKKTGILTSASKNKKNNKKH